jgi:hypothetical protein
LGTLSDFYASATALSNLDQRRWSLDAAHRVDQYVQWGFPVATARSLVLAAPQYAQGLSAAGLTTSFNAMDPSQSSSPFVGTAASADAFSGTTISVPRPASTQVGDLIFVLIQNTLGLTWTPAAGFTQVGAPLSTGGAGGPVDASRFWKIDNGGGPFVFTASGSMSWGTARSASYRGVTPTSPVDATATSTATFSGQFVVPAMTTTQANDLLVIWGSSAQAAAPHTPPTGVNVRQSGNVFVADTTFAASGAQGSVTIQNNPSGADNVAGGIAFKMA